MTVDLHVLASQPSVGNFVSREDVLKVLRLIAAKDFVWNQGLAVPRVPRFRHQTPATVEYPGRGFQTFTGGTRFGLEQAVKWLLEEGMAEVSTEPVAGRCPAVYPVVATETGRRFLDVLTQVTGDSGK